MPAGPGADKTSGDVTTMVGGGTVGGGTAGVSTTIVASEEAFVRRGRGWCVVFINTGVDQPGEVCIPGGQPQSHQKVG